VLKEQCAKSIVIQLQIVLIVSRNMLLEIKIVAPRKLRIMNEKVKHVKFLIFDMLNMEPYSHNCQPLCFPQPFQALHNVENTLKLKCLT